MLRHGGLNYSQFDLYCCDTRNTPEIQTDLVDLVVSSPPFLDTVGLPHRQPRASVVAGIDIDAQPIAILQSVKDWRRFTAETLQELCRVVKPGGTICYEVGEVRNASVKLEEVVLGAIRDAQLPVKVIGVLVNQQDFTKTSNAWGVTNNRRGTNTNRVVMMTVLE